MAYGIRFYAEGPLALFSRPELKVERVSYAVITPSAARGLLESIYWHPGLRYTIDRIYVQNPIAYTNIRRNEVKNKISAANVRAVMNGCPGPLYISTRQDIQQRASMVLRDVRYVIEAHFDLTDKASPSDNAGKFIDIIRRRLRKGQCFQQPCLGTREFPARFGLYEEDEIPTAYPNSQQDLGLMLYDMDYSDPENIHPVFFHAVMKNGVIDLRECEVFR